jgi:hypothetical protein
MIGSIYYANILLTKDIPLGKMHGPKRKKGDWYHSISVFSQNSISDLSIGESIICTVIHFHGKNGGPVLENFETTIKCLRTHIDKKIYCISGLEDSIGVLGDIRTLKGYEKGWGECKIPISDIINASFDKWGKDEIPYSHQRNESYNCVAFVDDILIWVSTNRWNERIEKMHEHYGLY